MTEEYASSFYATSLCFTEALGVLKAKHFGKKDSKKRPDHIDQKTYLTAAQELMDYVRAGPIKLVDIGIAEDSVFSAVENIARTYKLDIVDAYQIVTVRNDYFSRFHNADQDVRPVLVTADRQLAKAAQAEGLRVWHFPKGSIT